MKITGKDTLRYLRRLSSIAQKSYGSREAVYSQSKDVHAVALEKSYIVKDKKDIWRLTKNGRAFLQQLQGNFQPEFEADWELLR